MLEPIDVIYNAMKGGSIAGLTHQKVSYGGDAQSVIALADEGYIFYMWSDGVRTAERTDTNITLKLKVTAAFLPITETVRVAYVASSGGSIIGSKMQYVSFGGDAETVTAVADEGYIFVGWSDGATTAERTDKSITLPQTVRAIFQPIDSEEEAAGLVCKDY
jgi:uncharacterized repeat protein (TIGR02543 family)